MERTENFDKISSCSLCNTTINTTISNWEIHKTNNGLWTPDENDRMREAINIHGKDWKKVSKMVKTRNSKQCREHWKNTLDPSINKGPWTDEEDNILTEMLKTNPSGWSHIVPYLDHRTPLQARNRSIQLSSKKERKHIGASTLDSIELPSQYGFDLDDIYDGFNSF